MKILIVIAVVLTLLAIVLLTNNPQTVVFMYPNHQSPPAVQEYYPFSDGTGNPIPKKFDFKGLKNRKIEI